MDIEPRIARLGITYTAYRIRPPIVRRSWATLDKICPGKRVRKRRGQRSLTEYIG